MKKKNNLLFKFYELNELANISNEQFSHFGWEGKGTLAFLVYAESYKRAGELVYEKMKIGSNSDRDALIFPLCFNYRHCMEMLLKFLFIKYSKKDEEGIKKFLDTNHDLNKIWNYLKPILEININKVDTKVDINLIESYVKEMHTFDKQSMKMRYPITKQLTPNNDGDLRMDFHNFHSQMLAFYKAICQIDFDIDNQNEHQASKEDFNLFLEKYNLTKENIKEFINTIKLFENKLSSVSTNIKFEDLWEKNNESVVIIKYLNKLSSDDKIMIEVLYYAGRAINSKEVSLSKSTKMKVEDFINFCLFQMKSLNLNFESKIQYLNTASKMSKNIINNIETAMNILNLSS